MRLLLPLEHGAWGVLLVPYLATAAIARRADGAVVLCLAALFLLYLARQPLELLLAPQAMRYYARRPTVREAAAPTRHALWAWFLVYGTGVALVGLPLLIVFHRFSLLILAAIAAVFFVLRIYFLRRRQERSLAGEWLVVPGLTLGAPAAWIAATGMLDATAFLLWLLHTLFFSSGIFYVKFRIRVLERKQPVGTFWQRVVFARDLIAYHLLMLVFAVSVVHIGWASNLHVAPRGPEHWSGWIAALPFLPAAVRALTRVVWFGGRFEIRRLGWTEVAHSLVFGALLVLTFGLRN